MEINSIFIDKLHNDISSYMNIDNKSIIDELSIEYVNDNFIEIQMLKTYFNININNQCYDDILDKIFEKIEAMV